MAYKSIDNYEVMYNEAQAKEIVEVGPRNIEVVAMSSLMRETTQHYGNVKEFMIGAKQDCPESPCLPDPVTRKLRASLILEEAFETVEALGCFVREKDQP